MNHHNIKILQEHYNNVRAGTKTFEIRNNERAYQKGDTVSLRLWVNNEDWTNEYNPELKFKVGDVYPIDAERVVFSLLKYEEIIGTK